MLDVFTRFLTFEVISTHPVVPWAIGTTFLLLILSSILSITSLNIGRFAKTMWGLLIILLPIIGLFIYSLRCLCRSDWSILKPFFPKNAPAVKAFTDRH